MTIPGRAPIPAVKSIAEESAKRKAWLCDVWGVLHDGLSAFVPAIAACRAFRETGGEIVLISNSPRPSADVLLHLHALGITADCFDAIVTSGDVTRRLAAAYSGEPVFHIGPERDMGFFDGLGVIFTSPSKAKVCICTGFFDEDREMPEDYDPIFAELAARGVPMISANPDLYVERGERLLPCAGLLAARYEGLGQTVIQAGKPYAPIYEAAFAKFGGPLLKNAVLAIGDGVDTDIKGAAAQGIDAVYIASRVFMEDGRGQALEPAEIDALFVHRAFRPCFAMTQLHW
jgi:HAD superfamily hydrolase (TIGR01459 family)